MKNIIVCIEANIGAGKSTLLNNLKELHSNKPIYIIPESVDIWQNYKNEEGKDIFTLYYDEPDKYAYIFQNFVLNSFLENLIEYNNKYDNSILIFERSLYCIQKIFLEALYLEKKISNLEYKIFNKTFKLVINLLDDYQINIVYLRTTPEVCMERVKRRNRKGEENIKISYLDLLHKCHENWLSNNPNVKIIDGNQNNLTITNINELLNK